MSPEFRTEVWTEDIKFRVLATEWSHTQRSSKLWELNMKMSEDKEEPTKENGKKGLEREEENQANRGSWKPSRDRALRMRQPSTVSNSAYRSPKIRMVEDK